MRDDIGLGVFATRRIPRGTITWVLDALDQRFNEARIAGLGPRYRAIIDRYAYLNGHGEWILCWDTGRFMNHSCTANSISTGWDFDLAIRDIEADEEITNDYALLNLDHSFACACGSPACRGTVSSTAADWEALTDRLDDEVRNACADAARMDQPLWHWVQAKAAARRAFRNPRLACSVAEHRFDRQAVRSVRPAVSAYR